VSEEFFLAIKRGILAILILITIPTANLLSSYDTIDPWKSLGTGGGREYISGDTLSLYCGSLYALLLLLAFCLVWRKGSIVDGIVNSQSLKFWLFSFVCAWLLCTLPTYKILYFRLIQFIIGFGSPIFVALALEEISSYSTEILSESAKRVGLILLSLWTTILIIGQVMKLDSIRNLFINKLGTGGILGFEKGFWAHRYQLFVDRLSLNDLTSFTLLITQILLIASFFLYIKCFHNQIIKFNVTGFFLLLALQTLMLSDSVWHSWNWNTPQKVDLNFIINTPYWREKGAGGLTEKNPDNAPIPPPNFLILYNQSPPFIYESLNTSEFRNKD
jgi:hypothetical protein